MTRAEREALAAAEAAREAGAAWFKANPEIALMIAWREAADLYASDQNVEAFVEGFQAARKQRDDYLAEQEKA